MILREQESYSTQIWIGVGLIGIFCALVSFLSPQVRGNRAPMSGEDVSYSYEMPRAEPEEGPFDLSGRDVKRDRRELEALQKRAQSAALAAGTGAGAKAGAHGTQTPTKPISVKPASAPTATAKLEVETISESDRYKMSSGLSGVESTANPTASNYYNNNYNPAKAPSTNDKKEEDAKLTSAQWRSLMHLQPTSLNVTKLLNARNKGDIDDVTVLEITKELLKDASDERRKAGLMVLDRMTSAKTFEFLVKEKAEFGSELQVQMQKRIESYALPTKLIYLGPVLAAVEDNVVLSAAMEQLQIAVAQYKKHQEGQITQSSGEVASLQQLRIFVSTLRRVGQNEDTIVAQQALDLSTTIQGLKSKTATGTLTETQTASIE